MSSLDLFELDMTCPPTTTEIIERLTSRGRVSLDEVKRHPHGAAFPEPAIQVAPKDEGWSGRLDVGSDEMMADVRELAAAPGAHAMIAGDDEFSFRLLRRRVQQSYNTSKRVKSMTRGCQFNPVLAHPDDLEVLGLEAGDVVTIQWRRSTIPAVVVGDATLWRGLVSMAHGFGDAPDRDDEYMDIGSSTSRLLSNLDFADRYVGMPRMSNIPVRIVVPSD